jgi:hypothetical protein
MKVTLEFGESHHYTREYTQSSGADYCPGCGSIGTLWVENSPGDYYCGPDNICTHCGCSFTIQGPSKAEGAYKSVIEQIRAGKQKEPTTKEGN